MYVLVSKIVRGIFLLTSFLYKWHRRLLRSVQSSTFMGTERSSLSWACRRITHLYFQKLFSNFIEWHFNNNIAKTGKA